MRLQGRAPDRTWIVCGAQRTKDGSSEDKEADHVGSKDPAAAWRDLVAQWKKGLNALHVSVVAGANAVKRLWPMLDAWLGERSI